MFLNARGQDTFKICFLTTDGYLPHQLGTNGIPSSTSLVTALAALACTPSALLAV